MTRNSRPIAALFAALLVSVTAVGCAVEDPGDADLEEAYALVENPIILVPGCAPPPRTNAEGAQVMNNFKNFFLSMGYPASHVNVFVLPGATCHSNVDWAVELGQFIDQVRAATDEARVDIVSHSMGVVAARIWVRNTGGQYVRNFVQLAGANHGSHIGQQLGALQDVFGYPAYEAAKEMYPPYACQGQSTPADVQFFLNGCLTATGRTVAQDESPFQWQTEGGFIRYLNIWNSNDEIIQPPTSSCLNQDFMDDCSDPVNELRVIQPAGPIPSHQNILNDAGTHQRVYEFLTD